MATSPLLVRVKADAKSVMLANEVNFGRCSIPITFRTLFHAFDIKMFSSSMILGVKCLVVTCLYKYTCFVVL